MFDKKGYSFIESLVVLLVISTIILVITIQPKTDVTAQIEERIFFDNVISELKKAQQTAILQQKSITIRFHAGDNQILIRDTRTQEHIATLQPPNHIAVLSAMIFQYYPSGSVDNFSTVIFYDSIEQERIYLVFQFGNGQFEIQR